MISFMRLARSVNAVPAVRRSRPFISVSRGGRRLHGRVRAAPSVPIAMCKLIAACLALAALSLLLPSEPSYDPLAWLIWGELAHLQLDTSGRALVEAAAGGVDDARARRSASSTTGCRPPSGWPWRGRGRCSRWRSRSGSPPARGRRGAGALAGAVAAVALLLTPDWFQFAAHGSEAPLAVALMLWAIERHLDGRRDHAVVLGTLACLLRPELVPFLGLYGLWAVAGRAAPAPAAGGGAGRCCRWPGSCPSGSARAFRSTAARRRAASRPGACRWPSTRGCGRSSGCTTTRAWRWSCWRCVAVAGRRRAPRLAVVLARRAARWPRWRCSWR